MWYENYLEKDTFVPEIELGLATSNCAIHSKPLSKDNREMANVIKHKQ